MKLWEACQRNRWRGERERAILLFECGAFLKKALFSGIEYVDIGDKYSFESLWYLVCLFHEKQWKLDGFKSDDKKRKKENEQVFWEENKKWSPIRIHLTPSFVYDNAKGGIVFGDNVIVRECLYPETKVRDYFYQMYICGLKEETDHGIVGGLLLYDEMMQCVLEKDKESFREYSALLSYLSCTLMAHNLYCMETSKKLCFTDDPMLYLLVLTHAIEPLQTFHGLVGEMAYEAIEIVAENNRLLFSMPKSVFAQQYVKNAENFLSVLEIGWHIESDENCISMQVYTG